MGSGPSKNASGFRVFRVSGGSPASEAGLEVFFDYIVEVDGKPIESEQQSFLSMIKVCFRIIWTVFACLEQRR